MEGADEKDVTWIRSDGAELQEQDWADPEGRALGMLIDGAATDEVDERGHAVRGDTLLMILNGGEQNVTFNLPALKGEKVWVVMVDTAKDEPPTVRDGRVQAEAHALMLLRFGADRRMVTSEDARREPLGPVDRHTP